MTNIAVQSYGSDPNQAPSHALPGGRPEGLPLSASIYDASVTYGKDSQAVVVALYEAVKDLERLVQPVPTD
ncbi:hypothetical protein [Nocardia sp. NPDC005366]|uniref:hypothetical protein n=1 Tax=Nocardia sp. NPDC005366 TaxID=3156878 RepID=UPI00339F9B76